MTARSMRLTIAALVLASGASAALGQTFTRLAPASGSSPLAFSVSPSGQWVAGGSIFDEGVSPATIWNAAGTRTPLATHGFINIGHAIADSGATIAGESDGRIVIWRDAAHGGDAVLDSGAAMGLSADGSVAAGHAFVGNYTTAFAYHGGALHLLPFAPGFTSSYAAGVNGPGTLIAGQSNLFDFNEPPTSTDAVACLWPVAGGSPEVLTSLPGLNIGGANDVSDDGSAVAGWCAFSEAFFPEPFPTAVRWKDGVPTSLVPGTPGDDNISEALAISADGQVVVGKISTGPFYGAFIWDTAHGLRDLRQVLVDAGLDLTDLSLSTPYDLSGDGTVIVGIGFDDAAATTFAWKATLPRACAVDLNGDGVVDFGDYLEFLNFYDSQDLRADFNHDGLIDFGDYLEFLNLYDAGC